MEQKSFAIALLQREQFFFKGNRKCTLGTKNVPLIQMLSSAAHYGTELPCEALYGHWPCVAFYGIICTGSSIYFRTSDFSQVRKPMISFS